MKLEYIGTNNVTEDEFNTRLGFTMVIIGNWRNTCTIEVIEYIRLWLTRCSDDLSGFSLYVLDSMILIFWIQHLKPFWTTYGKWLEIRV